MAKYLRGLGLIGQQQGGTGPSAPPATWQYHLPDALGSVRQVSDASGEVILSQNFDPFGGVRERIGLGQSNYGFAGEEQDPDTDHLFLRARTYNPSTGRFLQPDRIFGSPNDPRTLHRYGCGFNNAVNYTDPFGLIITISLYDKPDCKKYFLCIAILTTADLQTEAIALVDTQPSTGNNALPPELTLTLILDHHPWRVASEASDFTDVRPQVGATCSIMVEYLRAAKLSPPPMVATVLYYGIKTDTLGLGRGTTKVDTTAICHLLPRMDIEAVSKIENAQVPVEYFKSFTQALQTTKVSTESLRLVFANSPCRELRIFDTDVVPPQNDMPTA